MGHKKKVSEDSNNSKIKILKAVKWSDGKVSVTYAFNTSFGEEKRNTIGGTKSYVEKKLRDDFGWRDFIDYKSPS